jgi:hypothetical protein
MRSRFEDSKKRLLSSKDEDEVIEHLTHIVKSFSYELCQGIIRSNPYFMSIFLSEIKDFVLKDLYTLEKALIVEMNSIEDRISESENDRDVKKLEEIKKDCVLLLRELTLKIEGINSI